MTLAEFFAWEERQPMRYEFDGLRPVAMTGGTAAHAKIQGNLHRAIGGRLSGRPCEYYGNDLKVQTSATTSRYPDGFVMCTPVPDRATVVHDPVVIFEVLSESTAATDFGEKSDEYAAMPSVQRYVLLRQDKIAGTMFERVGGEWIGHLLTSETTLRMPEIGIKLPLAELYTNVAFATGTNYSAP